MCTIIIDYYGKSTWALFSKCPSIGTCKIQLFNIGIDVDFLWFSEVVVNDNVLL